MKFDLDQTSTKIAKGGLLTLSNATGSCVAVLWGAVWLTQEGDWRDYELRAGESMEIRASGLTVVSAMADSAISVLEPSEAEIQPRSADGRRRYLEAGELELYAARARQLRAQYIGASLARLGRFVATGFARLGQRVATSWAQRAGGLWAV